MAAPIPPNERERLAALRRYGVLDTPPDDDFDGLVRLVAMICDVPYAMITLLDEDRQFFKSEIGFGMSETPRDDAFCAHTIVHDDLLVVPDASNDARFRDNPLVAGDKGVRFYAGAQLVTAEGHVLGTVCVLDRQPRQLTDEQRQALEIIAGQAMNLLELRREVAAKARLVDDVDRALHARERVLSIVSHDLRTPLGTVEMTAELLAADEGTRKSGARLKRAAGAMHRLVDDLLDFESMDRGQMSMRRREVAVIDLLDELVRAHELEATEQEASLVHDRGTEGALRGVAMLCDPGRVNQALGNLVHNALRHVSKGGTVTLAARASDSEVAISVSDDGPGFDEETARHLFEPFYRGTSARGRGAGLGLAIAKHIAETHGGRLTASGEPGRGATFVLALPRSGAQLGGE